MIAVTTLLAVVLVVVCYGQLVSSSPMDFGEILQPGPNTYTVGEGKGTKVEVRRVPRKSAHHYLETTSDDQNSTVTFGELTSKSNIAI